MTTRLSAMIVPSSLLNDLKRGSVPGTPWDVESRNGSVNHPNTKTAADVEAVPCSGRQLYGVRTCLIGAYCLDVNCDVVANVCRDCAVVGGLVVDEIRLGIGPGCVREMWKTGLVEDRRVGYLEAPSFVDDSCHENQPVDRVSSASSLGRVDILIVRYRTAGRRHHE